MRDIGEVGENGHDDELVATVADEDAARPVVEALLLAGLGPAVRPGRDGVEVTVVAGQGERAREVLSAPEPEPSPFAEAAPTSETSTRGPEWSSLPAGTAARAARHQRGLDDGDEVAEGPRFGVVKVLVLFAVACVVIPLVAFFISYRAAGG